MTSIEQTARMIPPLDALAADRARMRLDSLTKPLGSLGRLEELAVHLAAITGQVAPPVSPATVVVVAGDHGVTAEGVSAYPSEVTPQMVLNFLHGGAAINVLSRAAGAEVEAAAGAGPALAGGGAPDHD
ncbi:MAG TPA: nicotinate-nucleotide--dimethylbenzimidazole phosphoribosyltransferase [Symbiobacteriaceae bacterium]|nr:nicotinate-nucleotide--dimethylbenzimidazole phosphoribosyltransferase [Symbiobacteriaceae bacterium]